MLSLVCLAGSMLRNPVTPGSISGKGISMISTKANLVVDLGNSETRVLTQTLVNGSLKQTLVNLPNRFAIMTAPMESVGENYFTTKEDDSKRSFFFTSKDEHYVSGDYADVELADRLIRPTSLDKKYKAVTTDWMLQMAFLAGYEALSKIRRVPMEELQVEWNVVALMPPADVEFGKDALEEKIRSVSEIDFQWPSIQKEININSVQVLPEGFTAFLGVLFDRKGKVRKEFASLASKSTLVIDVGAGTSDFLMIHNGEMIKETMDTVAVGGNNVMQLVRRALRQEGLTFTEAEISEAIKSGVVEDGQEEVSIVEYINKAKQHVARSIISGIRDFLETSPYPPRSVVNLLVVGGGSLNTVSGAEPLSKYLVDYFREMAPNVGLVSLPSEKVKVNGVEEERVMSPRVLNALGGGVVASKKF